MDFWQDHIRYVICIISGADPGGGGQGCLGPPHFLGKKQGGQKPHTQKKKISKSDNHEARYRLKRTTKHTKYAKIF